MLYDSHIHLTDTAYDNFLPSILITLRGMRIKTCSVTVNNSTSLKAIKLFEEKNVQSVAYNFVGIHPQFADENISMFEEIVTANLHNINGIGEIGLDPAYYNQQKILKYHKFNYSIKCYLLQKHMINPFQYILEIH